MLWHHMLQIIICYLHSSANVQLAQNANATIFKKYVA